MTTYFCVKIFINDKQLVPLFWDPNDMKEDQSNLSLARTDLDWGWLVGSWRCVLAVGALMGINE